MSDLNTRKTPGADGPEQKAPGVSGAQYAGGGGSGKRRVAGARGAWSRFAANKAAVVGLVMVLAVVLASLVGPVLYARSAFATVGPPLIAPFSGKGPILGTDSVGRDVLAELLTGGRLTLLVGLVAGAISMTIGIAVGACGGYFSGWVDSVLTRLTETALVIPVVLFAMVLLTLFGTAPLMVALAIGVVAWPATARVARAEFAKFRHAEFVKAAVVQGASGTRIMLREILPNAAPPLIVITSLVIAVAMLFQVGLSFLGLTDPNQMTWGLMIGVNQGQILTAWWPVTFPGLAVVITVLGLNLMGGGINDALSPQARRGRGE